MDVPTQPRKPTATQIGNTAEKLALDYLQSQGLKLVARNFACKFGEIDLVMQHNDVLVFVEVRYRKHQQYGTGAESVDYRKQQKILKSAEFFLQQNPKYKRNSCRVDVMSIGPNTCNSNSGSLKETEIHWIANAIES
jgi:putative endonuclease